MIAGYQPWEEQVAELAHTPARSPWSPGWVLRLRGISASFVGADEAK